MVQPGALTSEIVLAVAPAELNSSKIEDLQVAGRSDSEIQERVMDAVIGILDDRLRVVNIDRSQIDVIESNRIRVRLPSTADPLEVRRVIESTGRLEFRIVAGANETANVFRSIDIHFSGEFLELLQRPASSSDAVLTVPEGQLEQIRKLIEEAKQV
jgi:preprotein translocase subunit SecD